LLNWIVCNPRQRPEDVTGVNLACNPNTRPISSCPSTTALFDGSTCDLARIPNATVPPGPVGPAGGLNTTVAVSCCCGYTDSTAGVISAHGIGCSPTTSSA
jgi:hypothetical protein